MVVQSTNTGGDLSNNHFDIQMPGGGLGIFDGCTSQFGSSIPGERYGGVTSRSQCDQMPELLKDGCYWRFDWFNNADNPDFTFEQVQCPKAITDVSGCTRSDDGLFPVFEGGSKPAPGGEEVVSPKPSSTKAVSEPTKAPEASEPTTPEPVDESDNGVEQPEEDETTKPVEPVDDNDETTEPVEPVDEEDTTDEEEDCEELPEENDDTPEDENDGEIIEDGDDDEEDCEDSEAVEEDPEDQEDDEEEDEECSAPAPQPGGEAKLYHQCGGINWTGPTKCAQGSKCEHWNPYYYQCIAA